MCVSSAHRPRVLEILRVTVFAPRFRGRQAVSNLGPKCDQFLEAGCLDEALCFVRTEVRPGDIWETQPEVKALDWEGVTCAGV